MTFSNIYTSSTIKDKITKIAAREFECEYDDVGMIVPSRREVPKNKDGSETKKVMCFFVFDHSLENIGTVYRKQVRNYQSSNGKSEK